MIDSWNPYPHQPDAGRTPAAASTFDGPRHPLVPAPAALLRGAVRELRALDLQHRRSLFATSGAGLADVPARDRDDTGLEPDRRTGLLAQLRAATTLQVRALRRAGEPPERVIAQVKHGLQVVLGQEGWTDPIAVEGVMRRVVRWSIVAYYDA